jgi:hypothetical protein
MYHTPLFLFSSSHVFLTRSKLKCWEVIFVGTSCVISSFDDDILCQLQHMHRSVLTQSKCNCNVFT